MIVGSTRILIGGIDTLPPVLAPVLVVVVVVVAWAVLRRFKGGFSGMLGASRRLREMALMEERTPWGTREAMDIRYTLY